VSIQRGPQDFISLIHHRANSKSTGRHACQCGKIPGWKVQEYSAVAVYSYIREYAIKFTHDRTRPPGINNAILFSSLSLARHRYLSIEPLKKNWVGLRYFALHVLFRESPPGRCSNRKTGSFLESWTRIRYNDEPHKTVAVPRPPRSASFHVEFHLIYRTYHTMLHSRQNHRNESAKKKKNRCIHVENCQIDGRSGQRIPWINVHTRSCVHLK
jgi:hypothetical protein